MSQQYPHDPNRPFVPSGAGTGNPPPTAKRKPLSRGAKIGWSALAGLVVFMLGALAGNAGANAQPTGSAVAVAGVPAPAVTVTASAKPVEVPGAAVTVTAPPVTVTKPAPPAKTVTAQPPQAAAAITEDGTYEVGVDIKPGKYKSAGGDGCYWARMSSLDGDLDSIITNNISDGPQTVTIKKSDKAFTTERCGEWRKAG
jgi:hypothetical protein